MAKLNQPRTCAHCGQPVKPGSDFLRAHVWGAVAYWHFSCWIRELREHDRRSAEVITGTVLTNSYNAGSSASR